MLSSPLKSPLADCNTAKKQPASSPVMTARTGRDNQRYAHEDGCAIRLVAGTIPFRASAARDGANEVLVIQSVTRGDWIFPKGGWETDESLQAASLRETAEEAGVAGELGDNLGVVDFLSNKKKTPQRLHMFLMRVDTIYDVYAEDHRNRQWVSLAQVPKFVQRAEFQPFIERAIASLHEPC